MITSTKNIDSKAIRFSIKEGDREVGRAFLYLIKNDINEKPYGLLEDVYIEDDCRGMGIGTKLIKEVLIAAKDTGCYKVIATSRYTRTKVHALYEGLGFVDHGKEFRLDY